MKISINHRHNSLSTSNTLNNTCRQVADYFSETIDYFLQRLQSTNIHHLCLPWVSFPYTNAFDIKKLFIKKSTKSSIINTLFVLYKISYCGIIAVESDKLLMMLAGCGIYIIDAKTQWCLILKGVFCAVSVYRCLCRRLFFFSPFQIVIDHNKASNI